MAIVAFVKPVDVAHNGRWRVLAGVCLGVVLSMTTWFSATAITPDLVRIFVLTAGSSSWLTNMVQLGFVVGALVSSVVSLPDLVPLRLLMGVAGVLAALANLSLLWVPDVGALFAARFITGVALAGIYPPALKLISTWFVHGRGLALGSVIAALTLGSAFPNLVRALIHGLVWQDVVIAASVATLIGAGVLAILSREGPFPFSRAVFDPRQIGAVLRNRPLALANLGYFGHMWELYAMWGWFLAFTSAALPGLGLVSTRDASLITFVVVASGVAGAVLGGFMADRIGRTATSAIMMVVSGLCALTIGFVFTGPLWLFMAVAIVWGVSVIGDSAQFSAMATEVSDSRYVGTAIALQLGLGFALTIVSIRLTPLLATAIGWRWSFLLLVPGPAVGVIAMLMLRRHPDAHRIAHGRR
ncbi:MFS transporter [Acidocella sp.]|uniref:MFS transporter n=1 Tax=Acidocella sp. TaxID=50710 RepID=UPI003D05EDE2